VVCEEREPFKGWRQRAKEENDLSNRISSEILKKQVTRAEIPMPVHVSVDAFNIMDSFCTFGNILVIQNKR
jgi:hypothetical protein